MSGEKFAHNVGEFFSWNKDHYYYVEAVDFEEETVKLRRCPFKESAVTTSLGKQWYEALKDLVIRHHDPAVEVEVRVTNEDPPYLHLRVLNCIDTSQPLGPSREVTRLPSLAISSVRLTYFPGVAQAREWLAAAWSGYIAHEALELVTVGGDPKARVWDPNDGPEKDRGLRRGLPADLTPETLETAMSLVIN